MIPYLRHSRKHHTADQGGGGDFPVVESTAIDAETSRVNSGTPLMPAGIQAGDFLIALLARSNNATGLSAPGWNIDLASTALDPDHLYILTKQATGGDTLDLTWSDGSTRWATIIYRISGAGAGTPHDYTLGPSGSTKFPDPPSHSPAGGSNKYLWLAAVLSHSGNNTVDVWPTDYSNGLSSGSSSTSAHSSLHSAQRSLEAASEDPSSFEMSSTGSYEPLTIAISP